jgi:ubiquinone biosynthesis protein UbiJ
LNEPFQHSNKATLGWPFSFVLNHLLQAEPWARKRLEPFAGEVVELRAAPFPALRFTVLPGGGVEAGGTAASLVVTLAPDVLLAALRGEEHLLRSVEVAGNAQLASEVMQLVRHLRWDVEEDLSRVLGDAAAHRLVGLGRGFAAWQADAARRLAAALADYGTEEQRLLVRRGEHAGFAAAVAHMRAALDRLDKRIDRLGPGRLG